MQLWSERGWGSRVKCPASECCSGCGFMLMSCNVLLMSLPIPLPAWLPGRLMLWLSLPWLQVLSWRKALFLQSPNALFGHMSFLLTWHRCRPRILRVSLSLVPKEKLWWSSGGPFLRPPVGSCSEGSHVYTSTCPQVFWGKDDVSHFWWWTGRIRHPMMIVTSMFVLTEFL